MSSTDELTVQERNKQIAARYSEEFWGKGNENIVDELCSDDFVSNYPMHGRREGKIEVKKMLLEFRKVSWSKSWENKLYLPGPYSCTNVQQGISKCHFSTIWTDSHDS